MRLDRWFKLYYPHIPHAMLQKHLRKGLIRVEGKKAEASARLETGQEVRIPTFLAESQVSNPAPAKPRQASEHLLSAIPKWVIHKDKDILALNKPSGIAVQGGSGVKDSIDGLLDALRFGSEERPKLVHRIDKDTSGILLLARHAKAARELTEAFRHKETRKLYWALVAGMPERREGEIHLSLSKGGPAGREKVSVDAKDGKKAVTLFRVVEALGKKLAWVELEPVTGRTHQLRVHMAAIGHPIIGDGKYGGKGAFIEGMKLDGKLHLHARSLELPERGLSLTAPLTGHMKASWKLLGFDER
ncbi:MAG: RluA family pseudouridine synthase [Alphaproteobacteria bacterium]|nr:RluA family pseudouridine synthase [Alphaproteobacteria bacterium]